MAQTVPCNPRQPEAWKVTAAFAVIYLVWGSTFFAIRIGVHEVAPILFAAMRFVIAGVVLFGWTMARRERMPTTRQWMSIALLALLIFVADHGLLFWAEQRVPSGIAAVLLATIPLFTALGEITLLRTQRLTFRLVAALILGVCGVAVLVTRNVHLAGQAVYGFGAGALIVAAVSWSIASVMTRLLPLPESKTVSSGAQMLVGGVMLTLLAACMGDFRGFRPSHVPVAAWFALLYLIVAGSLLGFTVYVWLIHHESPTKVGTYAYVNPVVAVLLGYFLGGEPLGMRAALGTAFVLLSVIIITTAKKSTTATAK